MREKQNFGTLDGLRGLAALCVVVGHYSLLANGKTLIPSFGIAVDFFFMMSGVVIESSYQKRLLNDLLLVDFIKIRMIRLGPLYLLSTGIILACRFLKPDSPAFWAGNWFHYPIFPITWSLSFELAANIFYARFIKSLTTKVVSCIVAIHLLLFIAVPFGSGLLGAESRVGLSYFLGVLIYRLYIKKSYLIQSFVTPVLSVSAFVFVLFSSHYFIKPIIIFFFPALLYFSLACNSKSSGFKLLGEISYPLYVIHPPIILLQICIIGRIDYPILLPINLVLSYLAFKYFDVPIRKALTELSRRTIGIQMT